MKKLMDQMESEIGEIREIRVGINIRGASCKQKYNNGFTTTNIF